MHLPTAKFSRLVTILAFDFSNPSLDSMILTWDHISARLLARSVDPAAADKIESIRLLAIHDAVRAIFNQGLGFLYIGTSSGSSLAAALAATAQASHDVLAAAFDRPDDRAGLAIVLEECLSLISDVHEKTSGALTGAESAAEFVRNFEPLALKPGISISDSTPSRVKRNPLRLAQNPRWRYDWQRSA
ncbi:MAG: hypothetical protein WCS43_10650 [Verrucomicrobiota bacterium]